MRTLPGWILGAVFAVLPVAHADEPPTAFDTLVECDVEAAFYEYFQSKAMDGFASAGAGSVTGAMILEEARPDETWASSIGFLAENAVGEVTELLLISCADNKLCPRWRAWRRGKNGKPGKVLSETDFGDPKPTGEWAPFRISFAAPRQWLVEIGGERQSMILPKDIISLKVKCSGAKGRVRFDLGERIS